MGFLYAFTPGRKRDPFHGISREYMEQAGCTSCPLRKAKKAPPEGAEGDDCEVYMLGEAPGEQEAAEGRPFVGPSGRLLRNNVPAAWRPHIRYNNVVQSWPPKQANGKQAQPSPVAIAHCRGYLIRDIEEHKPKAIFGFGNVPLEAMLGHTGITRYAGKRMPVKIGNHVCWYFPLGHPAAVLHADPRNRADLEAQFAYRLKMAFARLSTLGPPVLDTEDTALEGVRVLTRAHDVTNFLARAAKLDRVGIDYETTGLSPYAAGSRILTVALATGKETVSFALDHREAGWTQGERRVICEALSSLLEAETVKVAHNVAFEMLWTLHFFGKRAIRPTRWGDSLAQAFLLDSRPRAHSLDFLVQLYFGLSLKALSNLDPAHLDDAPVVDVCRYNALDAKYCLRVFEVQEPMIAKAGMLGIYHHHVARTASLVRCQHAGLPVDRRVNYALADQYKTRLTDLSAKLKALPEVVEFEQSGMTFNVASPRHVAQVLGNPDSTSEEVLSQIGGPLVKAVLDWRGINKVLSTYLLPLQSEGGLVTNGRIHPVISTTYTRTWRTAASDPNIQNFPQRDTKDKLVRKQVVAEPGCLLVSVDYSGIQARNVAMESKDARLVQAFLDHYDIHADWSERVQRQVRGWAKGRDQKTLRNVAKNKLVFPLFFGAQPHSIANYLSIDNKYGPLLYEQFWGEFPEIKLWHDKLRAFYARHHYVTGLSKFRRHAPINDNMLINSPIQSDEALLVCEAMTRLSGYEDPALQCVMFIHDDLTFMVPKRRYDECINTILHEMLKMEHLWLNVPLAVEVAVGENWGEQQKVGTFESDGLGGYREMT